MKQLKYILIDELGDMSFFCIETFIYKCMQSYVHAVAKVSHVLK